MFRYTNINASLLLLRIALGLVFIMHGWAKWQNIPGTTGFFASLGLSVFFVYLVATAELVGGIFILIGLFTRFASAVLVINMIFAILLTKIGKPFFGYEFDLTLLLALLALVFSGSGKYSVEEKIRKIEPVPAM